MKRYLPAQEPEVLDIWLEFLELKNMLNNKLTRIAEGSLSFVEDEYVGLKPEELRERFDLKIEEAEFQSAFKLLARSEGALRIDFKKKAERGKGHPTAQFFRRIFRLKGERTELEGDILKNWRREVPEAKTVLDNYEKILLFRHWIAHGRHWNLKLGFDMNIEQVYELASEIESVIINY